VIVSAGAGIPLAILATVAYNSGLILEKRALRELPAIDARRLLALARTLLSAPPWLAGFALMLCGLAFQVLALMSAPVTVVQPVLASGVAVVLILSRLVLRERLGTREYLCVAGMAVCVVLLALSDSGRAAGGVGQPAASLPVALVAIPTCLAGLAIAGCALRTTRGKHREPATGVSFGIGTGLLYGVAAVAIKALAASLVHPRSAAAVVVTVVSSPYLYVMAACSAAALALFQTALQRCRASIVVPVSNLTGSIYFMAAGSWLFAQRLPASGTQLTLRITGIMLAACVVFLVSRRTATGSGEPRRRQDPARRSGMRKEPAHGA
jgi:drug/metabolite transporter (DMT)-like permease